MQKISHLPVPLPESLLRPRTLVFAETSPEARALYEWINQELTPVAATPVEISVWQGLMATVSTQGGPCRVQTPLGEGFGVAHRQRGPIRVLAVALSPEEASCLVPEAQPLELIARLALTALQLKAARNQASLLKQEQERVVRQERLRAQAEVVRSFAHEFNNLLATVLLRTEMAAGLQLEGPPQECFAAIYECASRGARVVGQLQDFSGAQPRPDQDLVDLGQLVQTVAEERWADYHQVARGSEAVRLVVDVAEDLHVVANASDIREIVGNLLDNAREAMGQGGTATVTVSREKRQAVVRIRDTGPGMSTEAAARACEPFFTTKGAEHLGLGLSVVHGIVSRSGGKLVLAGDEKSGLTALVSLPLADLRAVRRELRFKRDEAPALLRNLNVLVVDDEPGMRETLALSLESMGHRVSQAVDGRQAMGLIRYHDGFDALVLDLVMPEIDGWEVAYLARKLQPQAAVLLLTAWGEKLAETCDDRADAVLAKPVSMKELNLSLCQAVRRRREA